ncbi:MAG: hypothetical protein C0603_11185 [Denitrovibrio sp.]|nr:MAG: hypothetical protein C0603_11185 [Denitrovibrio sp.]
MSKKVIKDEFVRSDKLKHFGFEVYETVELGEKKKKLEKVGEMEYEPGEINSTVANFDDDIEMGRAIIVQDRQVKSQKFAPKEFNEPPVNEKKEEPEPEIEEVAEPEPPAITEADLNAARAEGKKAGYNEGHTQGKQEGITECQRAYEAQQGEYMGGLQNTYQTVIAEVQKFTQAVDQLDEALPEILISMVKDIVGEERKINDDVVASIAKKSLSHLRELEKVVFLVHPDDIESMKIEFPDYETEVDKSVIKGSLKVATNIGEMNFSIERMLEEFVDRIHEEFSPTQEG